MHNRVQEWTAYSQKFRDSLFSGLQSQDVFHRMNNSRLLVSTNYMHMAAQMEDSISADVKSFFPSIRVRNTDEAEPETSLATT